MENLAFISKWQILALTGILALAIVAATAIAGILISSQANAHGGDDSLVHACVNSSTAEVCIAHPGPGNADIDCTAGLGAPWTNVHLDDDWAGAGTGILAPANLTDNVGIGTDTPSSKLEIFGSVELSGLLDNDFTNFFDGGCVDNQYIAGVSSEGTINCGANSGDIAEVIAGIGLTGGGTSGPVTLDADTMFLQRRVSSTWLPVACMGNHC